MKKMISKVKKFFGLDEQEFEDNYDVASEEAQVPVQKEHQVQKTVTTFEEVEIEQPKGKTFRFPLIDDQVQEKQQMQQVERTTKKSVVFQDPREDDTLRLPKHLPSTNQVLDVEVSGIRDLLEKRGRVHGTSPTNVVRLQREKRPVRSTRNVTRDEAVFLTDKPPARKEVKSIEENPAFVNPMQQKKRFTPTHVPSPVYGFQQPRPIRELLKEERKSDLDIPVVIAAEEVVPTSVHNNEEILTKEQPTEQTQQVLHTVEHQEQPVVENNSIEEVQNNRIVNENEPIAHVAKQNEEAPQQTNTPNDVHRIHEMQLQNVTFENSTVHIGQIHVEPTPTVEKTILQEKIVENQQPSVEEKQIISEEIQSTELETGSKLPFNVLMLKSDKEKLMGNNFQQIKSGVPPTIVEKVELRREAQKGLKEAGLPIPTELQDDEQDGDLATKSQVEQLITQQDTTLTAEEQTTEEKVQREEVPIIEEEVMVESDAEESSQLDDIERRLLANFHALNEPKAEAEAQQAATAIATLEAEKQNSTVFDEFLTRAEQDYKEENFVEHVDVIKQTEKNEEVVEQSPTENNIESTIVVDENESVKVEIQKEIHSPQIEQLDQIEELDQQIPKEIIEPLKEEVAVEGIVQPLQQVDSVNKLEQPMNSSNTLEVIDQLDEQELKPEVKPYEKPSLEFLVPPEEKTEDFAWMDEQAEYLIEALQSHQIQAQVESIVQGPAVTQFEITVAAGTKVSKVRNLSDDIKLALAAKDIRIDAPIPGKRTIGIEIPNRIARAVRLSEVTDSEVFQQSDSPLEAALGLDLNGKPVTLDLRKMPHGLIAGATGSGKSVCINSILVSLLYKADPHELKLMLIDPKMVELAPFNRIPHLVSPVITDVKAATAALKWAVDEMERRYALFMHAGVRDITRYNSQAEKAGQHAQKMPYLLIVIDELADLMMMSPADVEEAICRIAQKARACGIHLIVATQRPSVDVITGLIKSNIPTRIAFAVSSA
ncbi:MAG: DNA translocase FtsK, partial [Lysinibacillus sp.]